MALPEAVAGALTRLGYAPRGAEALTGGVASDIWKVETARGTVCVKRALPRLKVAQLWEAPVERNAHEVGYFRAVAKIVPEAVPKVLAHDRREGLFVMPFLEPARHRLWKESLRLGNVETETAAAVGERLARIHAGTAGNRWVAARFATDKIFLAIRLEPYLQATARAHPDLAEPLEALVRATLAGKRALVHGDVSPKNILVGPEGPVFLDAECAWYGDPAFDIAFCLNHLLLKCLWTPRAAAAFLDGFDSLAERYFEGVGWEPPGHLEARAAALLPGLFLARVDGKSPVEYLSDEADKARVRKVARPLIVKPPRRLAAVRNAWAKEVL